MKLFYLILIVFLVACKGNKKQENNVSDNKIQEIEEIEEIDFPDTNATSNTVDSQYMTPDTIHIDEYYNDPLVVSYTKISDTMVINEDCVLFLWLDSLEVAELQQRHPDGYIKILDDMIYYVFDASIALNGEGIKNFFCDKLIIQFNDDYFIKRKEAEGNMIFFKQGKVPLLSYAIDFNLDSCRNYFKSTFNDTIK